MSDKELVEIEKITDRLVALTEKHQKVLLSSAELNHRLRLLEVERLRDLAKFTHEIKKPLLNISSLSEKFDGLAAQKIKIEVSRATRLADEMLTLARLQLGKPGEAEQHDLSEIVRDVFSDFKKRYPQKKWRQKIQSKVSVCIPLENFFAVLENLLENAAVHASAGTQIFVELSDSKDEIFLKVADDGAGISPKIQKNLTAAFVKNSASGGSGLGLAIVSEAVEKLGGTLDFDSRRGHTEFRVRFPKN